MKAKKEAHVANRKDKKEAKPSMAYVERENVQFVGLDLLDPSDQERIKKIIHDHYIELERELKNIKGLKLHFKEYKKQGKGKYSVHLFVDAQTRPITAEGVYTPIQWDPVAAVHNLLDKAKEQIRHKFRTDEDYPKPYSKGHL